MNEKLTLINKNGDGENARERNIVEVNNGSHSGKAADADVLKVRQVSFGAREREDRMLL